MGPYHMGHITLSCHGFNARCCLFTVIFLSFHFQPNKVERFCRSLYYFINSGFWLIIVTSISGVVAGRVPYAAWIMQIMFCAVMSWKWKSFNFDLRIIFLCVSLWRWYRFYFDQLIIKNPFPLDETIFFVINNHLTNSYFSDHDVIFIRCPD